MINPVFLFFIFRRKLSNFRRIIKSKKLKTASINNYTPGLQIKNKYKDKLKNNEVIRVSQTVKGYPIFGSDLAVHITPENEVKIISGQIFSFDLDQNITVSKEETIQIAKRDLSTTEDIKVVSTNIVVYIKNGGERLTWHIILQRSNKIELWNYFIDTEKKKIFDKFNRIPNAMPGDIKIFNANNSSLLPGQEVLLDDETPTDSIPVNLYNNLEKVYDYFMLNHFYFGYDGNFSPVIASVHYKEEPTEDFINAFWSPSDKQFVFGDGGYDNGEYLSAPLGNALDVVAHEFGHAVTEYTAKLDANLECESLNESMSDLWGAMVDNDDWKIGEDVWTPNIYGDSLRDMANPKNSWDGGQPDHMRDYDFYATYPHKNAGIPNKACYLIGEEIGKYQTGQLYGIAKLE